MTDKLCCPECGVHVDEHKATICLADWAAESVMEWLKAGLSWVEPNTGHVHITAPPWSLETPIIRDINSVGDLFEISSHFEIWAPQSSITDAWELVEKVADLHGCQFSIERVGKPWEIRCGKYGAVVSGGDLQYERPDLTLAVYADSAPLAITRAAIKATAPHGVVWVVKGSK